jgi:anion-transporting  ArsA/GET3 family ATPase
MASLLERKLIVVTGKGGAGKTTVACALGLLAAGRGLRTIVVELGDQHRIPDLFASEKSRARDPDRSDSGESDPDQSDPSESDPGQCHPGQSRPDHDGRDPHIRHGFHIHADRHAEVVKLHENLWSTSIDPERALTEWLQTLTGRISARLLASSSTFQYFAAAAPGAKELVSMVKVRELCEGRGAGKRGDGDKHSDSRGRAHLYDLVVLDAPATGHALAMLHSPQTFAAIVRVGPLAEQAQRVRELLEDPLRSAYLAVAHPSEMAVTETLELEEGLRRHLDRDLDAVIVNGVLPRRFSREEIERILDAGQTRSNVQLTDEGEGESLVSEKEASAKNARIVSSAVRTAGSAYERARVQQSQIARLRRQRFAEGKPPDIVTLPFVFTPQLDLATVRRLGARLDRKL